MKGSAPAVSGRALNRLSPLCLPISSPRQGRSAFYHRSGPPMRFRPRRRHAEFARRSRAGRSVAFAARRRNRCRMAIVAATCVCVDDAPGTWGDAKPSARPVAAAQAEHRVRRQAAALPPRVLAPRVLARLIVRVRDARVEQPVERDAALRVRRRGCGCAGHGGACRADDMSVRVGSLEWLGRQRA